MAPRSSIRLRDGHVEDRVVHHDDQQADAQRAEGEPSPGVDVRVELVHRFVELEGGLLVRGGHAVIPRTCFDTERFRIVNRSSPRPPCGRRHTRRLAAIHGTPSARPRHARALGGGRRRRRRAHRASPRHGATPARPAGAPRQVAAPTAVEHRGRLGHRAGRRHGRRGRRRPPGAAPAATRSPRSPRPIGHVVRRRARRRVAHPLLVAAARRLHSAATTTTRCACPTIGCCGRCRTRSSAASWCTTPASSSPGGASRLLNHGSAPWLMADETDPHHHWFWILGGSPAAGGRTIQLFVAEMDELGDHYLANAEPQAHLARHGGRHHAAADRCRAGPERHGRPVRLVGRLRHPLHLPVLALPPPVRLVGPRPGPVRRVRAPRPGAAAPPRGDAAVLERRRLDRRPGAPPSRSCRRRSPPAG